MHAAGGEQGLERLAQGGIDVVALDQYMPGLDGLETLERIMAIPDAPPVVFVTASQDSAIAVTALKAGAADYLVKDVQGDFIPLLQVAVNGALRQAELQKARDEAEAEVHASRDRYAALAAEREVLLREVNHRVGNSLQIIASLLHLQANSAAQDDVKAALTNAMGRVAAVAQVHRRLYTSHDLKSVLLNQYLEALLEDLRRSAEGNRMSRLTLKAEPIEIDPDRAVAIGIIVNELVMNAVKYAYPDGAGPIHVELKRAGRRSAAVDRRRRRRPQRQGRSALHRHGPAHRLRDGAPSSKPASSAIPPMPAPGSCCGSAAPDPPRRGAQVRNAAACGAGVSQRTRTRCARLSHGGLRLLLFSRMTSRNSASSEITPEVLLRAYACGIFPMAESADDPTLFWVEPEMRGVIPLDGFRIASRLARTVRSDAFTVTVNTAFKAVIAGCAAPQPGRDDTWINRRIRDLYVGLHELGHCHSVEVWQDGELVGGLYGVSLGRAFFGESMFHRARDASKVALVHLVARLIAGGFELLDTQYVTEHLRSFGAVEIPRRRYRTLLDKAIAGEPADFLKLPADRAGQRRGRARRSSPRARSSRSGLIPEQSAEQPAGPLLRRRRWRRWLLLLELRLRRRTAGAVPPASAAADASARAAAARGFGGSGAALTMVWSGPLQSVSQIS